MSPRPARTGSFRKQPLVSIIIVSYNYERYLAAAIRSALGQSHGRIEVIVADDGSADSSVRIARKFKVKVLSLKHGGIASAVSSGIKASKGGYFMILSADDLIHPQFVEKTLLALRQSPSASFAYPQYVAFGTESHLFASRAYDVRALLLSNYATATALVRRDVSDKLGVYDPELAFMEDWDYLLTLAENGYSGVLAPEPLLFYRQHGNQQRSIKPVGVFLRSIWRIREKHAKLADRSLSFPDRLILVKNDFQLFAMFFLKGCVPAWLWLFLLKAGRRLLGHGYCLRVPVKSSRVLSKLLG